MQRLDQGGSGNVGVQIDGDRNTVAIYCGTAHLTLSSRHKVRRPPTRDLHLLDPYRCPINLVGRDHDLQSLQAWLDGPQAISVQCRIGRAGSGKTRLAIELCQRAERAGWTAGFLAHDELTRFQRDGYFRHWNWPHPTLIVVDYAATSAVPLRHWLEDLADREAADRPPLRLLLLERHADRSVGWWSELTRFAGFSTAAVQDLLDPPEPLKLRRIGTAEDRRALLAAIMSAAAILLGKPCPPALPAPGTDPIFDAALTRDVIELEPLYLLMAGLAAVQTGVPHVLSLTRTDLAERLAAAELDRLARLATARGLDTRLVQHLAAFLTLMNGCTSDDLSDIASTEAAVLGHVLATGPDPITDLLADAFTGEQPDRLDPIRPDLIGEAAILETFIRQRRSMDWQAAAVIRACNRAGVETVATVIRTAQDFAAGSRDHPSLVWLDRIADHAEDAEQLMAIANQLPQQTANLRERSATIFERVVRTLRLAGTVQPELEPLLAMALMSLGNRLSALGRHEDALAATRQAVEMNRKLAATLPNAFRSDFAMSLNNFSDDLRTVGRREEALAAAEEAVATCIGLANSKPAAFEPVLAMALNNLGLMLSDLGQRDDALRRSEEAVAIYHKLTTERPDAFKPYLAGSLTNLGLRLSEIGDREGALAISKQAVDAYRELSAAWPDAHLPNLAASLDNLGIRLSDLGQHHEALDATERAVALRRNLAAVWPDAFNPDLATSLNNLGNRHGALGQHDDALAAAKEAVALRCMLAQERPEAFRHQLATSLNNLAARYIALGRREEALLAAERAVAIYCELATATPNAFNTGLALALATRAGCLEALDRLHDALTSDIKAIWTLRPIFLQHPIAVVHWMQPMCQHYCRRCEKLGIQPDAALLGPIFEVFQRLNEHS